MRQRRAANLSGMAARPRSTATESINDRGAAPGAAPRLLPWQGADRHSAANEGGEFGGGIFEGADSTVTLQNGSSVSGNTC